MDEIQKNQLAYIADLPDVHSGSYNLSSDGKSIS